MKDKALSSSERKQLREAIDSAQSLINKAQTQNLTPEDFGETHWNSAYFYMREMKFFAYSFFSGTTADERKLISLLCDIATIHFTEATGYKPKREKSNWEKHHEYMYSIEWAMKRIEALERAKEKCQLCGTRSALLQVHHNTYENLGKEPPEDLIVLCVRCHKMFHNNGELRV